MKLQPLSHCPECGFITGKLADHPAPLQGKCPKAEQAEERFIEQLRAGWNRTAA